MSCDHSAGNLSKRVERTALQARDRATRPDQTSSVTQSSAALDGDERASEALASSCCIAKRRAVLRDCLDARDRRVRRALSNTNVAQVVAEST
jgi:hypothetical protein